MPTILRVGPYRFFFYASDQNEPCHVHVERDENVVKFWLDPIRLQYSGGFTRNEIRQIHNILKEHQAAIVEAWDGYFNS
jgi:hypothetical protein